jgi:hypothetical protein
MKGNDMHLRALVQKFCLALVITVAVVGSAAAATQPRPPAGFNSAAATKAMEARHKAMARLGQGTQLSPAERVAIQENARRNDPRIYTPGTPLPASTIRPVVVSPAERIAIQEDARRRDPRIFGTPMAESATRPVVEIVAPRGFQWADAGVGVGAALATVLLAMGAVILIRNSRLTKA